MTDPIAFEAIKMKWSQDKEGFVLTLRVHPGDVKEPVAMAPIGQQWTIALLQTPAPEPPTPAGTNAGATPDEVGKSGIHPLVQKAGILAHSPDFHAWCAPQDWFGDMPTTRETEKMAVAFIRSECGIQSRKELATNPEAAKRFEALVQRYYTETR